MIAGKLRIGIDVGGTFTHGILINDQCKILESAKVFTTHYSPNGVAEGVISCLQKLSHHIDISKLESINHSTTQATNALLEGDVSPVEAYVFCTPSEVFAVNRQLSFNKIILSSHTKVPVKFHIYRKFDVDPPEKIVSPILIAQTMTQETLVEEMVSERWREAIRKSKGHSNKVPSESLIQTATSVSRLYGLKSRVKTGIINCAMLPRMLQTLSFMEEALNSINLEVPLMVIKSDGGLMPKELVFGKPISCLLSGPAAGATAGLHFAGISLGLFLDIGGTSTDISFVYGGKVAMRTARIGGHPLQVETLDIRTIALGGGSLIGMDKYGRLILGPRSSHIAGLSYLSFLPDELLRKGKLNTYTDKKSEANYYIWEVAEMKAGFTLTDFANLKGIIPETDDAFVPREKVKYPFEELLKKLNESFSSFERKLISEIQKKFQPVLSEYLRIFKPERDLVRLVGGGGGVYSALPFIAESFNLPLEVCEYYPVISALGAAMSAGTATVKIPSETGNSADIQRSRELAMKELSRAGFPAEITHIEYNFDRSKRILTARATASRPFDANAIPKSFDELKKKAEEILRGTKVEMVYKNDIFTAFISETVRRGLRRERYLIVLDNLGRVKFLEYGVNFLQVKGAEAMKTTVSEFYRTKKSYGDSGEIPPSLIVVSPSKLYNLATLEQLDAMLDILSEENSEEEYLVITLPASR